MQKDSADCKPDSEEVTIITDEIEPNTQVIEENIQEIEPSTPIQERSGIQEIVYQPNEISILIPTESDEDETPLGQLYPLASGILSSATLVQEQQDVPPPPYSTEPPPPYAEKVGFSAKMHKLLRKYVGVYITIDMILNLLLFFTTSLMHASTDQFYLAIIVPLFYLFAGMVGMVGYQAMNVKMLGIYTAVSYAKWSGDVAIAIYALIIQQTNYFDMPSVIFGVTFPMIGVRGFYSVLYPCYDNNLPDMQCGDIITGMYSAFSFVLFPQFGAISLMAIFVYWRLLDEYNFS
ncbi:hypothetical protein HK103_004574 [Boothiomyces macroporosus]|uniref:Uncharacterized protein n=1 Tax=Boothiomyces macroporosus TaxID=261099 RepID=A0AAD5UJ49_9FUNG|nr:hypothetical protein HK103_004574 [Boothiomyces macroporosus]